MRVDVIQVAGDREPGRGGRRWVEERGEDGTGLVSSRTDVRRERAHTDRNVTFCKETTSGQLAVICLQRSEPAGRPRPGGSVTRGLREDELGRVSSPVPMGLT